MLVHHQPRRRHVRHRGAGGAPASGTQACAALTFRGAGNGTTAPARCWWTDRAHWRPPGAGRLAHGAGAQPLPWSDLPVLLKMARPRRCPPHVRRTRAADAEPTSPCPRPAGARGGAGQHGARRCARAAARQLRRPACGCAAEPAAGRPAARPSSWPPAGARAAQPAGAAVTPRWRAAGAHPARRLRPPSRTMRHDGAPARPHGPADQRPAGVSRVASRQGGAAARPLLAAAQRAPARSAVELSQPAWSCGAATTVTTAAIAPGLMWVRGDSVRLAQVDDANLLNNAAKYTPPGGHMAPAWCWPSAWQAMAMRAQVRDDGMGIPPSMLDCASSTCSCRSPDTAPDPCAGRPGHRADPGAQPGGPARRQRARRQRRPGQRQPRVRGAAAPGPAAAVMTPTAVPAPASRPLPSGTGRVLVVDDNRDAADSLAALLESAGPSHRTVAYAADRQLALAARWHPASPSSTSACPAWTATRSGQRTAACRPVPMPAWCWWR